MLIVFEVFVFLILNVFFLCGNMLVCFLVYWNRSLRIIINFYIIVLVVSDLFFVVFVMFFGVGVLIVSKWVFGDVFC